MKKGKLIGKIFGIALVFVVIGAMLPLGGFGSHSQALAQEPKTWYVDDDKQDCPAADFTTIQEAVDAASPGDTIMVYPGTYTENVDVNKEHLTIQSENGADSTIVQAANSDDHVFEVTGDYVNISGFTIKGATESQKAGIYVNYADHCEISNNVILNSSYGIYLNDSSYNNIACNTAKSCVDAGIILDYLPTLGPYLPAVGHNIDVGDQPDRAYPWEDEPLSYDGDTTTFTKSKVSQTSWTAWLELFPPTEKSQGVRFWIDAQSEEYFFKVDILYSDSESWDCLKDWAWPYDGTPRGEWVMLDYPGGERSVEKVRVKFHSTFWGSPREVRLSEFQFKTTLGVPCSNNDIVRNTVSNNGLGIRLYHSSDNRICLNNFVNNTDNGYSSDSTNFLNSTEETTYTYNGNTYTNYLGNYWSDYGAYLPPVGHNDPDDQWEDEPLAYDENRDTYARVSVGASASSWLELLPPPGKLTEGVRFWANEGFLRVETYYEGSWHCIISRSWPDDPTPRGEWVEVDYPEQSVAKARFRFHPALLTYAAHLGEFQFKTALDEDVIDANGDGIGDTPYSIDGDNDNYPLMEPFENYGITQGLAESSWPKFRHDIQNSGRCSYLGAQDATLKWSYQIGDAVKASPAIGADGSMYFGSMDNKIYALNPDGTLKCVFETGDSIVSSPAVSSDGIIYFGSTDGKLYAIQEDGTLGWSFDTGCSVESSPTVAKDGTIYFGSSGQAEKPSTFYALNPDGTLKWSYQTPGYTLFSSPAISPEGTIYVTDYNRFYAFDEDEDVQWSYSVPLDVPDLYSSPAVGPDGTIFFGVEAYRYIEDVGGSWWGELYAINPDGTLKWSYEVNGPIFSSPAINSDGTIYFGSLDRNIYAVNPGGTLKWSYETDGEVWSSPAIGLDGTIYIGSNDNKFYAVNQDGTLKWSHITDGPVFSSPAIGSDETVYVGSDTGKVYAFGSDATPPTVSGVSPEDGATDVAVDTVITATFSEPMDSSTINETSFNLEGSAVSGMVTYDPASYTATFTPDTDLEYDHEYTARLSTAITDLAGNPLAAAYSWSFTTELEPFKFKIGDWVRTTANLNVREGPGLGYTIIDTMPLGTKGQILGGPVEADGFFWWDVEYAVGVRGWSAENWLELDVSEAPTCVVKLEMDGAGIDEVGVWEFFDIHVGDSASDIGIKQVRFSSDNVRDGYPTGEWTEWFDWNVSSEDWDATTKTKCWAFDTAGYKEVWAEVEDEMGHTAFGRATIFVPAPALPVLTSPLVITPAKDIYNVGDSLQAELTIKNIGDVPITLDVLTVGGRLNGFIPPEGAPDFTFRSVTLLPNEPYRYQGSLELDQIGQYHFFVAYQIERPTPDEKKLLDENNWNTCVDLGEGLTHASRVKNIIVYEEGVVPEEPSKLRDEIDRWKESHLRYQYPAYLRDADSFTSALATLWTSFTSFVTRTDLTKAYDDLYFTGIEYQWLSFQALMDAERSLESGNVETARKCLENSHMYWRLSAMSFSAAAEVFAGSLEAGAILAKGIKDGCQAAVTVGVAIVYPPAAPKVDAIYMSIDFVITTKVEGVDQATKDVITKLITKWLLKGLKFTSLSDSTLEAYVNRVGTEVRLDTLLANQEFMTEFGLELRNVITDRVIDEVGICIS